jgi:restriction system protein
MKMKMARNSLFAILLRSPWWISLVLVLVIALASSALLPAPYKAYGVMGGFPFLVIGIMAAWRQFNAPSTAHVALALSRAGAMSWRDFSNALEQGFVRQGYAVTRLNTAAADFSLLKAEQTTLVSCKRWKAANQGVDALRDLVAARESHGAPLSIFISLHALTENARRFAQEQGIHVLTDNELAQLLQEK